MFACCNRIDWYFIKLALFITWTIVLKQTHAFVLQDSYNILLKGSVHYKINQTVDFYEAINDETTVPLQIKVKDKHNFHSINRLAKQEYDKDSKYLRAWNLNTFKIGHRNIETKESKNVIKTSTRTFWRRMGTVDKKGTYDNDVNYDYNDLNHQYYIELLNAMFTNKTFNIEEDTLKSSLIPAEINKKVQNCKDKTCETDHDNRNKQHAEDKCEIQNQVTGKLVLKVYRFIKIVFLIYTVIAVPMWFTRGWCCCCLYCGIFKPRRTIEEGKKYFIRYPPGVFNINNHVIRYEPSEREKDKYEEFEHFLRTL